MKKDKKLLLFGIICLFVFISQVNAATTEVISCGNIEDIPAKIPQITRLAMNLIKIVTPICIIIFGSIDFIKAIIAQKEDEVSKSFAHFIKRLVMGLAVFIVFAVVQFALGNFTNYNTTAGCVSCFLATDSDCYHYQKTTGNTTPGGNQPGQVVIPNVDPNDDDDDDISDGGVISDDTFGDIDMSIGCNTNYKDKIKNYLGTKIVYIDISKDVIGCDVYSTVLLKSIGVNETIADNLRTLLQDACTYIKGIPLISNATIEQQQVITFGAYAPNNQCVFPHRLGLGIDLYTNWTFTYKGTSYTPYSGYGNSEWENYRKFVCNVCNGNEDCRYNINYQIYKIARNKGWCWGGTWSKGAFDPMHFEVGSCGPRSYAVTCKSDETSLPRGPR